MATKLTKKQKGFVKDYIDTGNGVQSALKNYDTKDYATAGVIAVENLEKPKIREALEAHAQPAESMIFNLSQKAKSEMVRYVSSKDILDRAGYKPVEKSQSLNLDIKTEVKDISDLESIRLKYEEELKAKLSK